MERQFWTAKYPYNSRASQTNLLHLQLLPMLRARTVKPAGAALVVAGDVAAVDVVDVEAEVVPVRYVHA